ncbi:pyridoxine 5'-phosphate synthase, partial [Klebsiella aerogenes]|uniref:pyridoxine 5'-phosphate synthase n=1 Tax=Klebsiella aerogenes TaxID=548 RepID=UPI001954A06C
MSACPWCRCSEWTCRPIRPTSSRPSWRRSPRSSRAAGRSRHEEAPAVTGKLRESSGERLRLGVNIDHVATVRNARGSGYPDP